MTRFIVCIDYADDDLQEAYSKVSKALDQTGLPWETSDEWYDDNGEQGSPEDLQKAILAAIRSKS